MSDHQDRANAELEALGAAYQGGGLDRDSYRARRRTLLRALRARDDATEPNPLVVAGGRSAGRVQATGAPVAYAARLGWWKWLVLGTVVTIGVLATTWLAWGNRG